jgi:hypothetical protein
MLISDDHHDYYKGMQLPIVGVSTGSAPDDGAETE